VSAIAQKIAAEHPIEEPWRCGCGQPWREDEVWEDAYSHHIATVTEQAVRTQLRDQFTARAAQARTPSAVFTWQLAARIAGGDDQ